VSNHRRFEESQGIATNLQKFLNEPNLKELAPQFLPKALCIAQTDAGHHGGTKGRDKGQ
jgi:hypothetical protein